MSTGPWGQKSQPPNALEATWKDPVAEKQAAKRRMLPVAAPPKNEGGGGRARPPPFFQGGALCACGILSIYLSVYI